MIKYCVGIDLGGTTTKIGIFKMDGNNIKKWQIPTNTRDEGHYILSDIIKSLKEHLHDLQIDQTEIKGIGMGIPGIVLEHGYVSAAVNLGWKNKKVTEELKQLINLPVSIINDANAAALGEMWMGSGKGYHNLVMITLGTGIGGGVVIDGKIVTGLFGAAGEIGHMPIVYDESLTCNCGRIGCLEQVASATGIVNEAKRMLKSTNVESSLKNSVEINAKMVCEAALAGDFVGIQVMERVGKFLGLAMASITSILDPEVFIIGGGVSKAGQFLLDMIRTHYQQQVLYLSKNTKIKLASLGNDAGIYGAAKVNLS